MYTTTEFASRQEKKTNLQKKSRCTGLGPVVARRAGGRLVPVRRGAGQTARSLARAIRSIQCYESLVEVCPGRQRSAPLGSPAGVSPPGGHGGALQRRKFPPQGRTGARDGGNRFVQKALTCRKNWPISLMASGAFSSAPRRRASRGPTRRVCRCPRAARESGCGAPTGRHGSCRRKLGPAKQQSRAT